jgi:hypothetical protein
MDYEIADGKEQATAHNGRFARTFLLCFAASISNGYLFSYIQETFFPGLEGNPIENLSLPEQLFLACLVAPLLETLIFQHWAINILNKIGVRNYYLQLVIPAILFGLGHQYNPLYVVAMFVAGIIMNYLFLYWVALLHCLYNLYGTLFVQ